MLLAFVWMNEAQTTQKPTKMATAPHPRLLPLYGETF